MVKSISQFIIHIHLSASAPLRFLRGKTDLQKELTAEEAEDRGENLRTVNPFSSAPL